MLKNRIPDTKPSLNIEEFTGTYKNKGYGKVKIENDGDSLVLYYNKLKVPMNHYHFNTFAPAKGSDLEGFLVNFDLNSAGKIKKLTIPFEPKVKPITFKRVSK